MNAKPSDEAQQSLSKWQERIQALHNVPPLFRMVWESAPKAVGANVACRIVAGLLPLAMLGVTQAVIAAFYRLHSHGTALPDYFWWLIALEFGLAGLGDGLSSPYRFLRQRDRGQVYTAYRHPNHGARIES